MAKHDGVLIHITKEMEHVAFGVLANDENVFVTANSTAAGCDKAPDGTLEGKYVVGAIIPNNDPEKRERSPWVCIFVNRMATEEEFKSSAPPTIKGEDEVNGSSDYAVVEPDKLDEATDGLGTAAASFQPAIDVKAEKKRIAAELIDEGIDSDDPNHGKLARKRLKDVMDQHEQNGRDVIAQLLTKGPIPGIIIEEAKRLVELGPEVYWANGGHPKSLKLEEPAPAAA